MTKESPTGSATLTLSKCAWYTSLTSRAQGVMATTWPNWVDLVLVTILLRTCYSGFARGLIVSLLNLLGAVLVTVVTMNYAGIISRVVPFSAWGNPTLTSCLIFWVMFSGFLVAAHVLTRLATRAVKWERVNWILQGSGLLLGGLRGVWWAAFVLVALASSGVTYLHDSAQTRSVLGARLLPMAEEGLERVADRFPGAQERGITLIPPAKLSAKR